MGEIGLSSAGCFFSEAGFTGLKGIFGIGSGGCGQVGLF